MSGLQPPYNPPAGGSGTIDVNSHSLFGNGGTVTAAGQSIALGTGFEIHPVAGTQTLDSTFGLLPIDGIDIEQTTGDVFSVGLTAYPAPSIFGNFGTVVGGAVQIGTNLSLSATGTLTATGGGGGGGIGTIIATGVSNTATSQAIDTIPYVLPTFTTWFNQGSCSVTVNTNGPTTLELPTNTGSNNIHGRMKAISAGAFTLTANIGGSGVSNGNGPTQGLILSDGTKAAAFGAAFIRGSNAINLNLWTTGTSFGSGLATATYQIHDDLWMRIVYDGVVTYTFQLSVDGFTWLTIASETITALTFTPTEAGIFIDEFNAGTFPYYTSLAYWSGV